MRWGIRHGLDGVITDDPKLFLEVRKDWHEGMQESLGLRIWLDVLRINFFALVFALFYRSKFSFKEASPFARPRVEPGKA
jgi:hypothetical protein